MLRLSKTTINSRGGSMKHPVNGFCNKIYILISIGGLISTYFSLDGLGQFSLKSFFTVSFFLGILSNKVLHISTL